MPNQISNPDEMDTPALAIEIKPHAHKPANFADATIIPHKLGPNILPLLGSHWPTANLRYFYSTATIRDSSLDHPLPPTWHFMTDMSKLQQRFEQVLHNNSKKFKRISTLLTSI